MGYDDNERLAIEPFLQMPVLVEDLHEPLAEALDTEVEMVKLRPEFKVWETIRKTLPEARPDPSEHDCEASYIVFIDALNDSLDLDIPSLGTDVTFEGLADKINRMIVENNILRLRVDWKMLRRVFREWETIELTKADLTGTVDGFLEALCGGEPDEAEDSPKLSNNLMSLIDSLYLDFTEAELKEFDALPTMREVYEVLDQKLRSRKRNDCRVKYGNNWSLGLRNFTRRELSEYDTYPMGVPMKFIGGGKFGKIWDSGIQVEGEPKPGIPEKGRYVIKNSAGLMEEYDSLESMLDDGWAID